MKISNAGFHFLPLLISSDGEVVNINNRGLPVANIRSQKRYSEVRLKFKKGDSLFLYTDGVAEQTNETGEIYGEERIIKVLNRHYKNKPDNIIKELGKDYKNHRGNKTIDDDITVLMIKRD